MHVIRIERLEDVWGVHPTAEGPMRAWFDTVSEARWEGPQDVKATYATASILKNGRVVFDVGGNRFRVVVKIAYRTKVVFIRWAGSHAEYDRIDADTI